MNHFLLKLRHFLYFLTLIFGFDDENLAYTSCQKLNSYILEKVKVQVKVGKVLKVGESSLHMSLGRC